MIAFHIKNLCSEKVQRYRLEVNSSGSSKKKHYLQRKETKDIQIMKKYTNISILRNNLLPVLLKSLQAALLPVIPQFRSFLLFIVYFQ